MTAVLPLVDQFALGLDAPICLTWELTYACNLACVHCLSSSGRRDPSELTTAECEAVVDELQRMQVFYVNIGGGEPTVRPDFCELVDYAVAHQVGREVLHQRHRRSPPRRPRGWPPPTTSTCRSRLDGATAEANDAVRGAGCYATACGPWTTSPTPGSAIQDLRGGAPATTSSQLDELQGAGRPLRRQAAAHPAAPLGPRRRRLGRAAPDRGPAAASSTTGWSWPARQC